MNKYILVIIIKAKCFSRILLWTCSPRNPLSPPELILLIRTFLYDTMIVVLRHYCAWESPGERVESKYLDSSAPPQKFCFSSFGMRSENMFFQQDPRWCWWCWSTKYILNSAAIGIWYRGGIKDNFVYIVLFIYAIIIPFAFLCNLLLKIMDVSQK